MNRRAMPPLTTRRLAAIVLPLLLCACQRSSHPAEDPPLAGAAIGGEFTLTDQHGQTRHWKDFRGKYAVV